MDKIPGVATVYGLFGWRRSRVEQIQHNLLYSYSFPLNPNRLLVKKKNCKSHIYIENKNDTTYFHRMFSFTLKYSTTLEVQYIHILKTKSIRLTFMECFFLHLKRSIVRTYTYSENINNTTTDENLIKGMQHRKANYISS